MNKTIVVGVIVLFIVVGIQPSIALNNNLYDKAVEIKVSRYRADSSIENNKVILSKGDALEFIKRYKIIDEPEIRFLLLKEYGLIPEDVTRDSLRKEMLILAEELGLTDDIKESISERYANRTKGNRFININVLNGVLGISFGTFNLPIGSSFITGVINGFTGLDLRSVDLLYIVLCLFGGYGFVNGLLPDLFIFIVGFFALLGFIGFVICIPFLSPVAVMEGFAVVSIVISGENYYYGG